MKIGLLLAMTMCAAAAKVWLSPAEAIYLALQQTHIPVELHLYAHGGHAFGVRETADDVTGWPEVAEQWMRSIGVLPARMGTPAA